MRTTDHGKRNHAASDLPKEAMSNGERPQKKIRTQESTCSAGRSLQPLHPLESRFPCAKSCRDCKRPCTTCRPCQLFNLFQQISHCSTDTTQKVERYALQEQVVLVQGAEQFRIEKLLPTGVALSETGAVPEWLCSLSLFVTTQAEWNTCDPGKSKGGLQEEQSLCRKSVLVLRQPGLVLRRIDSKPCALWDSSLNVPADCVDHLYLQHSLAAQGLAPKVHGYLRVDAPLFPDKDVGGSAGSSGGMVAVGGEAALSSEYLELTPTEGREAGSSAQIITATFWLVTDFVGVGASFSLDLGTACAMRRVQIDVAQFEAFLTRLLDFSACVVPLLIAGLTPLDIELATETGFQLPGLNRKQYWWLRLPANLRDADKREFQDTIKLCNLLSFVASCSGLNAKGKGRLPQKLWPVVWKLLEPLAKGLNSGLRVLRCAAWWQQGWNQQSQLFWARHFLGQPDMPHYKRLLRQAIIGQNAERWWCSNGEPSELLTNDVCTLSEDDFTIKEVEILLRVLIKLAELYKSGP